MEAEDPLEGLAFPFAMLAWAVKSGQLRTVTRARGALSGYRVHRACDEHQHAKNEQSRLRDAGAGDNAVKQRLVAPEDEMSNFMAVTGMVSGWSTQSPKRGQEKERGPSSPKKQKLSISQR